MPARWIGALVSLMMAGTSVAAELVPEKAEGSVRVATFNANLVRKGTGILIKDIRARDPQVLAVAEIIQRVRPDILLINEIDHDPSGVALGAFAEVLAEGIGTLPGWESAASFTAESNTGIPSGFDLDGDGKIMGARDAFGFGRFPGQYGMAVLVRAPLGLGPARTFQHLKWSEVPWATPPINPDGTPYYTADAWAALRLSSKSHWDVPVLLPDGGSLHLLASHPTPPVFDGPENRNGLRNAAEIRFWLDYIEGANWITDDAGTQGGLEDGAAFIVLGDLNANPEKGDGDRATIQSLTTHPRLQDPKPTSPGAAEAGSPTDTADWPETDGPGNLRVDYVLPSADLTVTGSGSFWPRSDDPLYRLVEELGRTRASSDHRLVWVDLEIPR